jgi:signal transduction histidine kinase/CheY-like chemotaxis protein
MVVIAWNFHYMINRRPGPGGVYAYATEAFGHDHGYLCAWFMCLTYVAIVASDTAALPIIVRYIFGAGFLNVCPLYEVAGFNVGFGDVLIAIMAAIVIVVVCYRRRLSAAVQTVLAVVFAAGFVACFSAAAAHHDGGVKTMLPLFSPTGGSPFFQFLNILTIAPWLFVGFEAISCMTPEFRFPRRRSFAIFVAAIVSAVAAYALLTAIPVFAPGESSAGWTYAITRIAEPNTYAFNAAKRAMGGAGDIVMACTLIGAIFTNLIGNTMVASRLLAAMADDGALPSWLGKRDGKISARNAVLVIAIIAIATSFLGQTVISVIVDVALIGAAVAYAYTSAAVMTLARREGNRLASATGLVGLILSVVIGLLFLLPVFSSEVSMMATESYLVLVSWGIVGIVFFLFVFRHDALRRFGQSSVVWISLFMMILVLSFIWIRQTTNEAADNAYDAIVSYHAEHCAADGGGDAHNVRDNSDWRLALRRNLSVVKDSIVRNNYVQGGMNILAIALMFCLYWILRRREREMEQEKARTKSYFFSTVSHDIRTPLNAIIGFSEMLKAGFKTDAERDQAVDAILVSGKTLLALINDVLDLSKLESGKMDITPEPTDCSRLLNAVTEAFRVSSTKSGVELRCRVGEMPHLMLDPQRIRQIVFNLVGNAVKFTAKGHVELRATFSRAKPDSGSGTFRIEVEDTGCGIGAADLKRIGSAYVQVGSKISRNGGTGLGLAICKQLASAMGGELSADSTLGCGSTFAVVIPGVEIAPEPAAADAPREAEAPSRSTAEAKGATPPGRPHRLLLADDSKMNLMVLKALLKHVSDFDVTTAADGQEALELLEAPDAKPFDLVLTDMWMPRMDGVGLVKAIRANPKYSSMRVVVVTADVEYQDKYEEMGFDGMLLKPITTDRLVKTLEEACK